MASLTTNISSVSLTVSGTTQQSTNISWTLPSVPSGATISSCVLTGTATASMSKGSATIQVNGTTVSSGSSFTIDLGTSNTTSSISATAVGGNKNADGTVTFSNLVYTVTYSEPVQTYTVTFVDWDGTVLKTEEVEEDKSATAPSDPSRDGYAFTGWDISYTNVSSNLTVTAQYEQLYTVTFVDYDGTVLKTEEVCNGDSATAPDATRNGYEFIGWSVDFSNVTSNITTTAQYKLASVLEVKENGNWTNIGEIYKKVSGSWIKQGNSDWEGLFDFNTKYIGNVIPVVPTAVLYSDGALIFSNDDHADKSHGDIVNTYIGWDVDAYIYQHKVPWDNDRANIVNVYINNVSSRSLNYWFEGCSSLMSINISNFNTSNVTDMNSIFSYCSSLTSLDLSSFDTSNVTNMNNMFNGCTSLTSLDLSSFDMSNVIDTSAMFADCSSLTSLDVSNFDTSNVTNMESMFVDCSSLTSLDVSNFDTSNVTKTGGMFLRCSSLTSLDLSSFDTSNVTNMNNMFNGCTSLTSLDLSSFDMSNVTNRTYMFYNCTNPNLTIYVKDSATKTKIESSSGFPSTATVVIGSMN